MIPVYIAARSSHTSKMRLPAVHSGPPEKTRTPRRRLCLAQSRHGPVEIHADGGVGSRITQADKLIEGIESECVIADRGYDSQQFRERIVEEGARPVIPPRSNREKRQSNDGPSYGVGHRLSVAWTK